MFSSQIWPYQSRQISNGLVHKWKDLYSLVSKTYLANDTKLKWYLSNCKKPLYIFGFAFFLMMKLPNLSKNFNNGWYCHKLTNSAKNMVNKDFLPFTGQLMCLLEAAAKASPTTKLPVFPLGLSTNPKIHRLACSP